VWTSHRGATLSVDIADASLVSRYAFGTGTATFHVCARCGAVPVVTSEIGGRIYAVVNVNVLEGVIDSWLVPAVATFDGEAVENRLARRERNWIPEVIVRERR